MRRILVIAAVAGALALTMAACGDDDGGGGSCESICLQAQAADCTTIDDCGEFCSVSQSLAGKAQCTAEWDDYHSCAQSTPTCNISTTCSSYEDDFGACLLPFCYANPSDADCIAAASM